MAHSPPITDAPEMMNNIAVFLVSDHDRGSSSTEACSMSGLDLSGSFVTTGGTWRGAPPVSVSASVGTTVKAGASALRIANGVVGKGGRSVQEAACTSGLHLTGSFVATGKSLVPISVSVGTTVMTGVSATCIAS